MTADKINVLLIGSGGRENALAWKIVQSPLLDTLYCLPGNPGTNDIAINIPSSASDFGMVKEAVLTYNIGMVVVGPEEPLVKGLRDYFSNDPLLSDIRFVGPSMAGAALEGSKDYAKGFMLRHNIPTAAYKSFTASQIESAYSFLETLRPPYVLKADGLAAGKGVLIIDDLDQAKSSLYEMFSGKFGQAGDCVVIEEFLSGIEISVFVLTDSDSYMILPQAKDYKRIGEGDTGLNTGGMGAVSPVPFADSVFMKKVEERIIKPTITGIKKEKIDYHGFIFIGLMNCGGEPYVIEYNVRMGDPETEAVMTRISSDFLSHLIAAADGTLSTQILEVTDMTALTVIAVSGGYPESYKSGCAISGLDAVSEVMVFHSGTMLDAGKLVTKGGRVLAVTALSTNIISAREVVYRQIEHISFEGMYYRRDIGCDLMK